MTKAAFAHVALNCRSIAATEKYYARHFGFGRVRAIPLGGKNEIVFIRSGAVRLELFKAAGRGRKAAKDGPVEAGVRHLAFKVASVDRKLKAMGKEAVVTLGPISFDSVIKGWRTAWVRDPDGRIVEISQGYRDERQPARK